MIARPLILAALGVILSWHLSGQKQWLAGNALLHKTWKETIHFLKTKDTAGIRAHSADTIDRLFVDYETGTHARRAIPLSDFFKQTLDSLVHDKKLLKALEGKEPQLETSEIYFRDGSGHTAYMVISSCRNPQRKANIYKYNQVIFTYVYDQSNFKLFGILTGS